MVTSHVEFTPASVIIGVFIMNSANVRGLSEPSRYTQWEKMQRYVSELGDYILTIMPEEPKLNVFATSTDRASSTAEEVTRQLSDGFCIATSLTSPYIPGSNDLSRFSETPLLSEINNSKVSNDHITLVVGHERTSRWLDTSRDLHNYSQVIWVRRHGEVLVTPGYPD